MPDATLEEQVRGGTQVHHTGKGEPLVVMYRGDQMCKKTIYLAYLEGCPSLKTLESQKPSGLGGKRGVVKYFGDRGRRWGDQGAVGFFRFGGSGWVFSALFKR